MARSQECSEKQIYLDSALLAQSSDSDSSELDFVMETSCESKVMERKNWTRSIEIKKEISFAMDLILKSIRKLQTDSREKLATGTPSSPLSPGLNNDASPTRLQENKLETTTTFCKSGFASQLGKSISKVFNEHFKTPVTPAELEFQQTISQFVRQDGNRLSTTDPFCTWIKKKYRDTVSNEFPLSPATTDLTESDITKDQHQKAVFFFFRILASAVAETSIEGFGNDAKVNSRLFKHWVSILQNFVKKQERDNDFTGEVCEFVLLLAFRSVVAQLYLETSGIMESIVELFCNEGFFHWLDFEELSLSPEEELNVNILFTNTVLSELD